MEYLALEHFFGEFGMRKLLCEVIATNTRVVALHKRFGFVEEGYRVAHVEKDGEWCDVHELALFADAWRAQEPAMRDGLFKA